MHRAAGAITAALIGLAVCCVPLAGAADTVVPEVTTSSYDHDGNLVQQSAPGGGLSTTQYDLADRVQLEAKARRRAEAAAPAAAARPEQIRLLLRVGGDDLRLRVDHLDRLQAVTGETELPPQQSEAAAQHMPGDADGRTAPGRDRETFGSDRLVDVE